MIKVEVLKNWIKELLSPLVFFRFKNIWNLKKYLKDHNINSGLYASIYSYYIEKKNSYIGIGTTFSNIPYFPHGLSGIFISDKSVIGKNAVIFQGVTIGAIRSKGSKRIGNPVIKDNCYIGAGAKILGNITIGNNCRIGANAVVTNDMPDNSVALAGKATIITKELLMDNKFYVLRDNGDIEYYENGTFKKED